MALEVWFSEFAILFFLSLCLIVTELYFTLDIYGVHFCSESTKVNLLFPDTVLYMERTTNSLAFTIQRLHPGEQTCLYAAYVFFVYELILVLNLWN